MKPCSGKRKLLAWLAVDALDAHQASELRAHLDACDGCRQYFEEISSLTKKLSIPQSDSNLQTSATFHHKLVNRLAELDTSSSWERAWASRLGARFWNGGLARALAAGATAVLALALLVWHPWSRSAGPAFQSSGRQTEPFRNWSGDLAPTLANYQRVANRSLDDLDELLTRQGLEARPQAPVLTAAAPLSAE